MKNNILRVTLIFVFVASLNLNAQGLSICNKVLEKGIRDTYDVQSLHLFESYLREILNYSQEELKDYVSKNDGSIAIPMPVAEAVLNAEVNDSKTKVLLKQLREKYSKDLTLEITKQDFESFSSSVINPKILNAWLECIRIITQGKGKIRHQIIGQESEVFGIEFLYLPKEEQDPVEIEIAALNVLGGGQKHVPTLIKKGVKLRRYTSYTQLFKRTDSSAEVIVKLDFIGRSGIEVRVPPLKKVELIPVGTVVTSILPWPVFAESVGDEGIYNATKNSWAPCDSRTIRGSELARLVGVSNTPDLRGAFLRGLNSFSTDEPSPVPDRQRDPKDRKQAGVFQDDNVGEHKHTESRARPKHRPTVHDHDRDHRGIWQDDADPSRHDTTGNPSGETRPVNVSVYYYIKIN